MNVLPKSVFYALLAIGLGILAVDFVFIYLPLSGWILQAILVGVYLEYLKPKKTLMLVAVMEIFFMASYGGLVTVAAILSLVGSIFFVPIIIGLYVSLIITVMFFGYLINILFHKFRLFERLSQKAA